MTSIGTCLVYGDDLVATQEAAAGLVTNFSCHPIQIGGRPGGHVQAQFNNPNSNELGWGRDLGCEATTNLILEMVAMATADLFVGSYSSNIPSLVHLMRVHLFGKHPQSARDVLNEIGWHHDWTVRSHAWRP